MQGSSTIGSHCRHKEAIAAGGLGFEKINSKDLLKNLDWKALGNNGEGSAPAGPVTKKRLPKKIREVPEYYFLPRRSLPSAIAIYGAIIAAGVGAGMLVEVWINKKIREDGGIIWEMDKS